jgi:hypothetical protein
VSIGGFLGVGRQDGVSRWSVVNSEDYNTARGGFATVQVVQLVDFRDGWWQL